MLSAVNAVVALGVALGLALMGGAAAMSIVVMLTSDQWFAPACRPAVAQSHVTSR